MKPLCSTTEEVKAILDGRKTRFTKPIKNLYKITELKVDNMISVTIKTKGRTKFYGGSKELFVQEFAPYKVGDILYVKETWLKEVDEYFYEASISRLEEFTRKKYNMRWKPPIQMPKDAARVFIKVTNIKLQKVQEISQSEIIPDLLLERLIEYKQSNTWIYVIEFQRITKE